jgi:hypothetical protein
MKERKGIIDLGRREAIFGVKEAAACGTVLEAS